MTDFFSKVQKEDNGTKVVFSVNRVLTSKHSHKKKSRNNLHPSQNFRRDYRPECKAKNSQKTPRKEKT